MRPQGYALSGFGLHLFLRHAARRQAARQGLRRSRPAGSGACSCPAGSALVRYWRYRMQLRAFAIDHAVSLRALLRAGAQWHALWCVLLIDIRRAVRVHATPSRFSRRTRAQIRGAFGSITRGVHTSSLQNKKESDIFTNMCCVLLIKQNVLYK